MMVLLRSTPSLDDVAVTSAPSERKTLACCKTTIPLLYHPSSQQLVCPKPRPCSPKHQQHNGRLHHPTPPSIAHSAARVPPNTFLRKLQADCHPFPRLWLSLNSHHAPQPSHHHLHRPATPTTHKHRAPRRPPHPRPPSPHFSHAPTRHLRGNYKRQRRCRYAPRVRPRRDPLLLHYLRQRSRATPARRYRRDGRRALHRDHLGDAHAGEAREVEVREGVELAQGDQPGEEGRVVHWRWAGKVRRQFTCRWGRWRWRRRG